MKEIGSIFPLYNNDLNSDKEYFPSTDDGKYLLSLCREALSIIADIESHNGNIVMIPSYTCDTVITPFIEKEWNCKFYPINKDLTINIEKTRQLFDECKANLIVIHPYCGIDLNIEEIELIKYLRHQECKVTIDLTQCIFTNQKIEEADYYIGSYRKWYQVPDGAYLWSSSNLNLCELHENEKFVKLQTDAMYLRGTYFEIKEDYLKQISIRLNKMATEMVDFNVLPHRMSNISYAISQNIDIEYIQQNRLKNYKYLHRHLSANINCEIVCKDLKRVKSAPLYFMIYTKNRSSLQHKMIEDKIYAPILWPIYYDDVLVDDVAREIYNEVLALPIDQRYDLADMKRIVDCINLL